MAQQNSPQTSPAAPQSSAVAPKVDAAPVTAPAPPAKEKAAAVDKVAPKSKTDSSSAPPRSMAQIESDMEATRQRLTQTIGELQGALAPKNLLHMQVEKVRGFYIDEYGAVRPDRVAMTAGVIVGGYVVIRVTKRIFS